MPKPKGRVAVLFVCTGNICRSPTAEGVFRSLVGAAGLADRIEADSAATHNYNPGKAPDLRSQAFARQRGYDLSGQRARLLTEEDFDRFDYLLAMDRGHLQMMMQMAKGEEQRRRVRLFMSFAPGARVDEVADPYGGENEGFEEVLDLVEAGAAGLLAEVRSGL